MADRDERGGAGGRLTSVWALGVWVLGSAVLLALARGATGFWEPMGPTMRRLDIDRAIGLVLLAPTVLVGARFAVDAARRARGGRESWGFGVLWRLAGVSYLAWVGVEASRALATSRDAGGTRGLVSPDGLRMALVTLAATIGLVGLLLGATPGRATRRARRPEGLYWAGARIVAAATVGVLLAAAWGMVPHLVLLAMEAVRNAMMRPGLVSLRLATGVPADPILTDPRLWPSLAERVAQAGLVAAIALASCGLTAAWLGRDLRRTPLADAPQSLGGILYRSGTTVLTWALGMFLVLDTLPRLNPSLAEGIWMALGPTNRAMIVAGFAALAAGIAARGLGDHFEVVEEPPPRLSRLIRTALTLVIAFVLAMIVLAVASQVRGDESPPWYVPVAITFGLRTFRDALTITSPVSAGIQRTVYFDPGDPPVVLIVISGLIWVIFASIRLLTTMREAPVDRVGRSPRLVGRFVGAWLALMGVMLTLLPALALAGLAVYGWTLRTFAG